MGRPHCGESLLVGKSLQELLQPQVVGSDATMVEVFGEKSQAADNSLGRIAKDVYGLASEIDPLSATHAGLAGAGMIPGIGNVADIVDAGIYGLEGKGGDAALSLAAAIPFTGIASRGAQAVGKFAKKAKRANPFKIAKGSELDESIAQGFFENTGQRMSLKGESTKFGRLLENRSKKKLYKTLSTKDEFNKYINTFAPELKDKATDLDFTHYKRWLKGQIYDAPITHRVGKAFGAGEGSGAVGAFDPNTRDIIMASDRSPSRWGSTLRHELKHKLDFSKTGFSKTTDVGKYTSGNITPYGSLEYEFERGIRPEVSKIIMNPKDKRNKFIEYMLEPTETLARTTQLKSKGMGHTLLEAFGGKMKPRRELEEIYRKDFIDELMNKYWAAAPIGALGTGMKLKDDRWTE